MPPTQAGARSDCVLYPRPRQVAIAPSMHCLAVSATSMQRDLNLDNSATPVHFLQPGRVAFLTCFFLTKQAQNEPDERKPDDVRSGLENPGAKAQTAKEFVGEARGRTNQTQKCSGGKSHPPGGLTNRL